MDRYRPPRAHRIDQHLQKVGAEDRDIGKSVALDRLGARSNNFQVRPVFTGGPPCPRIAGGLRSASSTPSRAGRGAVRADLNAGPILIRALFVRRDVMAAVDQASAAAMPPIPPPSDAEGKESACGTPAGPGNYSISAPRRSSATISLCHGLPPDLLQVLVDAVRARRPVAILSADARSG